MPLVLPCLPNGVVSFQFMRKNQSAVTPEKRLTPLTHKCNTQNWGFLFNFDFSFLFSVKIFFSFSFLKIVSFFLNFLEYFSMHFQQNRIFFLLNINSENRFFFSDAFDLGWFFFSFFLPHRITEVRNFFIWKFYLFFILINDGIFR